MGKHVPTHIYIYMYIYTLATAVAQGGAVPPPGPPAGGPGPDGSIFVSLFCGLHGMCANLPYGVDSYRLASAEVECIFAVCTSL